MDGIRTFEEQYLDSGNAIDILRTVFGIILFEFVFLFQSDTSSLDFVILCTVYALMFIKILFYAPYYFINLKRKDHK